MPPHIATTEDIPALVEMGAKFHAMSPHKPVGDYDRDAVARTISFLIDNPSGLVVRSETGVLGGMMAPIFFAPDVAMMEESFWWAQGGGQELRRFFETMARKMGARFVYFTTLENDRIDAIDRLMKSDGYKPVERRYMKELVA